MPTLLELFNTPRIPTTITPADTYAIRNSKDIRVIDGFAINALRRSALADRTSETRLEQELIGIRAIRGLRSPSLYGTDILRLKEKTTPILNDMKLAANGTQTQDGGLVGKGLSELTGGKINSLQQLKVKAEQTVKKVTDKLGINFPETKIPTRIVNDLDFTNASPHELVDTLKKIKLKSEGNFGGRVLASAFKSSTPNQIGNKIVGEALRIGKQQLKRAVFGVNEINLGSLTAQPNIGIGRGRSFNIGVSKIQGPLTVYTNKDRTTFAERNTKGELPKYSKSVDLRADTIAEQNDLASVYSERYNELSSLDIIQMYSNKANPNFLRDTANQNNPQNYKFQPYSKRRGVPRNSPGGGSGYELEKNIEVFRGITSGKDFLNQKETYYSKNGDDAKDATGKSYGDYDFIPLRFYSIAKQTGVNFRGTLTGFNETLSPTWDANKTLGNAFSYYTYSGIERSITFTFKVFSLNPNEHKAMWQRINFLTGLVYPANGIGVRDQIFVTPPFLKLTIGDMFKNAEGFIESLTYDVEDTYPWEIGFDTNQEIDLENWKLPRIVNVNITYKFLDTMGDSYSINENGTVTANRFYSFGGVGKNQTIRVSAGAETTNPDGSVQAAAATAAQTNAVANETKQSDIKNSIDRAKLNSELNLADSALDAKFTRDINPLSQNQAVQRALNVDVKNELGKRLRKL